MPAMMCPVFLHISEIDELMASARNNSAISREWGWEGWNGRGGMEGREGRDGREGRGCATRKQCARIQRLTMQGKTKPTKMEDINNQSSDMHYIVH